MMSHIFTVHLHFFTVSTQCISKCYFNLLDRGEKRFLLNNLVLKQAFTLSIPSDTQMLGGVSHPFLYSAQYPTCTFSTEATQHFFS